MTSLNRNLYQPAITVIAAIMTSLNHNLYQPAITYNQLDHFQIVEAPKGKNVCSRRFW